ncbi:hypothetical protein E2C01_082296 [Portunus trituberculatus]|uniref:Uncharacterized protein n=1 Tax=Portunus trituberculatus TaxID=210409 RepID=A0A5B7IY27_PORTR|nr:hypothetical protein [Portunus trituberculatus]
MTAKQGLTTTCHASPATSDPSTLHSPTLHAASTSPAATFFISTPPPHLASLKTRHSITCSPR